MTVGPEGGRFAADAYVSTDAGTTTTPDAPVIRPVIETQLAKVVNGLLTARFGGPGSPARLLRRVTVSASVSTRAYVYVGEPDTLSLVSGTNSGQLDEADYTQPVFIPESTPLVVEWESAAGSAAARVEMIELDTGA